MRTTAECRGESEISELRIASPGRYADCVMAAAGIITHETRAGHAGYLADTLGHYRIDSKLGEGGMGVVYRAFDTHLDRPVAIKILRLA